MSELAKFFSGAVPVKIPVQVTKGESFTGTPAEHTAIEFGTPQEVLFASGLPLDFDDTVRVRNADGSLDIAAKIVAMRFHHGKMAIAARFLEDVTNWIIKA
ncbi:MAG TPA: hypothetical protein VH724_02640 [Candidatus Angelobacter sp.]|nr:hypothetical protein [Candidatus Angelobacter sp.]